MKTLFFIFFPIFLFAQQLQKVDFKKCNATVLPEFETKSITGKIEYEFKVLQNIDTIRIDAKNMNITNVKINNNEVEFKNNTKELLLFKGFKKGKNKLTFNYSATPKQTLYFVNQDDTAQIWTQGQGKYTSYWLPSFDDVNEKVIFNLTVTYNNYFEIISNGIEKHSIYNEELNLNFCKFKMQKPMSSYLVMLAIGKFNHKTEKSNCGIPLENYYKPEDENKFAYTYKDSKKIFDFLEKKIGVKYPWKIYRQVPVEDFLYAGMENTTSTIFAQDFVVDEIGFNHRNYINVNAHELAHQWFGDLVTAKSGKHHWLQEGFATYYALLAEKEIFSDDYFYYQLYKSAQQIKQAAKTDTISVMNEKASSLSFYQKGAWALFTIKEAIGDNAFDKTIKNYLKKYKFKTVETDDFLNEIAKVSDFDTQKFKKKWLEDYHFQNDEANFLLKKNDFIIKLLEIQSYRTKSFAEKKVLFLDIIKSPVFYPVKTEIINQLKNVPFDEKAEIIHAAMLTNDIEVRQAVANTISKIPDDFKVTYESLLEDKSYDTKEIAFVNLWNNFPNERSNYLAIIKQFQGNNDKSTRILYLYYCLQSSFLSDQEKKNAYLELSNYTSTKYESSIRQNAFEIVLTDNFLNTEVIQSLFLATTHHKWQFSKFARDNIRELLKKENFKSKVIELSQIASPNLKELYNKFLNEKN